MIPLAGNVDLSGAWNTVWGALQASAGKELTTFLTVIGVLVLVFSIIAYVWGRMRNRGDSSRVVWALVVGALLCAPGVILPIVLAAFDIVINLGIDLYNSTQ